MRLCNRCVYRRASVVVAMLAPLLWPGLPIARVHAQADEDVHVEVEVSARPPAAVGGEATTPPPSAAEPAPYLAAPSAAPEADPDALPPWATSAGSLELGIFWGAFFPNRLHELYDDSSSTVRYGRLERFSPDLGLRFAYFPLSLLGLEVEAALLPTQVKRTNQNVNVYAVRGHILLQAPTKTIVPFAAVGGGLLAVSSGSTVLGSDLDGAVHFGIGAKGYVTRDLALRLDLRDNLTQGFGAKKLVQHFEAVIGVSLVLWRPASAIKAPLDSDHDGIIDAHDRCPHVPGVPPHGCPPPPPDRDGDGIIDAEDACPDVPGVADPDPLKNGCPVPVAPPDSDGDGVPDPSDRCPTVPGDGPDGCPLDSDGDGILNRDDKCPDQPETVNSFEDADGCPDELPQAVKKFTGTIAGIAFDTNKATIRSSSFVVLDEAAKVLVSYPSLRVEISGHTDTSGGKELNLKLSHDRADSVKAYLVGKGVATTRIETRGAGPNEPVADNATPDGRSKNRRVEFKLLLELGGTAAAPPEPAPALLPETVIKSGH
ncbi:MAG: hypothetical protein RL701_4730 [Pseudomonadota bacterium]